MPWDAAVATARINTAIQNAPRASFMVENYNAGFMARFQVRNAAHLASTGKALKSALVDLPHNQAVLVDGVHIYANLINFGSILIDKDGETSRSHERALQFLHTYYSAFDRLISQRGAIRVDFHGARLHAVIIEPFDDEARRIQAAIELSQEFKMLADRVNDEFFGGREPASLRVGIDSGKCLAIDDGSKSEAEPLFLGSAANVAAKLADGEETGLFLSERAQAILRSDFTSLEDDVQFSARPLDEGLALMMGRKGALNPGHPAMINAKALIESVIRDWREDLALGRVELGDVKFSFHEHKLPLRDIEFQDLMPSNTVRMPMVVIFADIDGYTRFVDDAIRTGRVQQALQAIHVLRAELNNVLYDDFGGRKIRYIGDCIHGVLASGTGTSVDEEKTVREAVGCASGMRSSFNIALGALGLASDLGLAIGIELGQTPITRLGIRGDRSLRCCTSKAVQESEALQGGLDGTETALGDNAHAAAPGIVKDYFGHGGTVQGLEYDVYEAIIAEKIEAPALVAAKPWQPEPNRSHMS
ncbi:MAG: guanylate cyclase [Alphaproteobacteria bacterium]|nr:MAG: guanylate cyclase [Alphaproteobacteria bacterium]